MAASKKTAKSKLISEQYLLDSPKGKKPQKRERAEESEEEDMSRVFGQYQASLKKKKLEANRNVEDATDSRQKILGLINLQQETRQQWKENLFKSLTEITTQVGADYNAMKENEQKLDHLTRAYMECIQQATIASEHKLKDLQEIKTSFKKQYDDMESKHQAATSKLMDEIDSDIKKLQTKLVTESKKRSWENLRRSLFNAMQNDI